MFGYYFALGCRSLRKSIVITSLMVLTMAIGIAACTTTLTVLRVLSGDPIPSRSATLFRPQIEPRPTNSARVEPPELMSYADAMALIMQGSAPYQAAMATTVLAVHSTESSVRPFNAGVRTTTADFFPMFATPFTYGNGWSRNDDDAHTRVAVISTELNTRLFHGEDSVGRIFRLRDADFRIVGVMAPWRPSPRFYDLGGGNYSRSDDVYIPLTTSRDLGAQPEGSMSCWSNKFDPTKLESAPCTWLQFWVLLPTPTAAAGYRDFLVRYSQQQRDIGRFQQSPNVRLPNLLQWLDQKHVIPRDATLQAWVAIAFLLVCVVNTSGLLLSKFLSRSSELAVRRAMGASRTDIFLQILVEAALVGVLGGMLGVAMSFIGLYAVRLQPIDYADLVYLDMGMLFAAVMLMLIASIVAAWLPAWLASRASVTRQLKTSG